MQGRTLTAGRPPTQERWISAGQKAIKEGVQVRRIKGSGTWIATSGTRPDTAYELTLGDGGVVSCSCPAIQEWAAGVCKHMAALAMALGTLALPVELDEDGGADDDERVQA